MRSLVTTVALVALLAVVLVLLVTSPGEDDKAASWTGRALLALGPIREHRDKHRHGRVEYRYQTVDCTDAPLPPSSSTTTTPAPTTLSSTTTTVRPTTTTTTTVPTTCVPPCTPSSDLCRPNVCIRDDALGFVCRFVSVVCNDFNRCTVDTCSNGTCSYVYNPLLPNCTCATLRCPSNGCFPQVCVENNRTGPVCQPVAGRNCTDNSTCTDDVCSWDPANVQRTWCNNTFNASIPGCAVIVPGGGGLSGGAVAGIVIGAVAAAAIMAALLAAWARRKPSAGAGATNVATTPLATASPLYQDPINAGVMPTV